VVDPLGSVLAGPRALESALEFDERVRRAELKAELIALAVGVDRANANLRLDGGTLHIESLSIDELTPLEALNFLYEWQQRLRKSDE